MKFKKLILFYLILDLILIVSSSYFGYLTLLNSQIAMIASMLILLASFYGYKSRVLTKASSYELSDEEKSLFQDEEETKDGEENSQNQDKKPNKFKKIDLFGAFKPYRLASYLVLIIAFFMLLRRDLFEPLAFLAGLVIMPLGVFLAGIFSRE